MHTREHILPLLRDALRAIGAPDDHPIVLDVPRRSGSRGDLSTGLALSLAEAMGGPPRSIAEMIVAALPADEPAIASVEIAGPGYINITFTPVFHALHLGRALAPGELYGRSDRRLGERVAVEELRRENDRADDGSALRGAILADALARLLAWRGFDLEMRPGMRSHLADLLPEMLGAHHDREEGSRDRAEEPPLPFDEPDGTGGPARTVLVAGAGDGVSARKIAEGSGRGRVEIVLHGGVALAGIANEEGGTDGTEIAALRGIMGETGPGPLRLHLLCAIPGATIRLDAATIARHSIANPFYAPSYALFTIDALLQAAASIARFDPCSLPIDLASPAALGLARHLLLFPDAIERSATALDPSILTSHLIETAALVWPIIGGQPLIAAGGELDTSRLPLLATAGIVLRNGFAALGVAYPEGI
jgi:arginyl-tRNA synthetase